jgi:hypothetical protein
MLNGTIKLDPILSCELVNPAVDKLSQAFKSGFEILYVYGGPGTGKSLAVEFLVDEYDYVPHYLTKFPETKLEAEALARHNSLVNTKQVAVIVDGTDRANLKDIVNLISVDWSLNKLILIGADWKKTGNPLSKLVTSKKVKFKKVKFNGFPEGVMLELLLRLGLKYRLPLSLDERTKIVKASNGDLRKALNACKYYLLGGKQDLEMFIPNSEESYFNRVKRMFSGDYNKAIEEVESFGWYYTIMILLENLEGKKKADDLIELIMKLSMDKMENRERYLALVACEMQKRYGKGPYPKWVFPKRAKKQEPSEIDALCSESKKWMYFV